MFTEYRAPVLETTGVLPTIPQVVPAWWSERTETSMAPALYLRTEEHTDCLLTLRAATISGTATPESTCVTTRTRISSMAVRCTRFSPAMTRY